jgi:hypothetical protein
MTKTEILLTSLRIILQISFENHSNTEYVAIPVSTSGSLIPIDHVVVIRAVQWSSPRISSDHRLSRVGRTTSTDWPQNKKPVRTNQTVLDTSEGNPN